MISIPALPTLYPLVLVLIVGLAMTVPSVVV
jgi:hypothetical protein